MREKLVSLLNFLKRNDIKKKIILEINDENLLSIYSLFLKENNINVNIVSNKTLSLDNSNTYIYEPARIERALDNNQFLNAVITLFDQDLDMVIVSEKLTEKENDTYALDLSDNIIYKKSMRSKVLNAEYENLTVKIISIPTRSSEFEVFNINNKKSNNIINDFNRLKIFSDTSINKSKQKKIVFVFPMYMAIGGVEKNTIEIMGKLKKNYDFIVIDFEKLYYKQGSLHNELKDVCKVFYEFGEIISRENYLPFLKQLKDNYKPDLVWVCNGSPWFVKNAEKLRNIFKDIPIVDQEVYDTKEGWIQHITSKGVKDFDQYIAINQRIKEIFIKEKKILPEKIDLIYSAIDKNKILKSNFYRKNELLKKYNLPEEKFKIAFLGRLTYQKNPLRFLKIAKDALNIEKELLFILVGSGELDLEIDTYINKYKLTNIIRIEHIKDISEFYNLIDVLIVTSHFEGLPIVSIEAMAKGIPILATDVGDMKIFLEKYNNGKIIENKKIGNDYEELKKFLFNYDIYKMNSEKNKGEILNFFSSENIADLYKRSFENVMKRYK